MPPKQTAKPSEKTDGELPFDARDIFRRTYAAGRVTCWRKNGPGDFDQLPPDLIDQFVAKGYTTLEYTEEKFIISRAGAKELQLRIARENVEGLKRQLALAVMALEVLERDTATQADP